MRESSPSILKLDKSLSHLRNLRANLNITTMQNLYKCTEGVVAKLSQRRQSKTSNDLVVDLPTKILDENINLNRIKKEFTIDGWKCLKTKLVKQKKQPNGTVQSVKLMFIFMHP